jgi:hypothetical protein
MRPAAALEGALETDPLAECSGFTKRVKVMVREFGKLTGLKT